MELFRKYLISPSEADGKSGADIVEKLADRFQSSTRIDDKRDALRALKALSKKYRLEVGTHAMPVLISALKDDRDDTDSVCYSLESLYAIMNDSDMEQVNPEDLVNIPTDLGVQFSEIFIKDPENIKLILFYVDAPEIHIRRHALRVLNVLLINRLKDTQAAILQCPMGISKLVDTISDPREALRNDAILLLLELTKLHTSIQKIVAFENVFERLISIIHSEGSCDGGVVVEDCLNLMCQLLDGNAPNQLLFREGNFIQRLLPFFDLDADDTEYSQGWSAQKVVNAQLLMQVVRTLVSPRNKGQSVKLCQNVMHDNGLLGKLCCIIMANGVPAEVLTKAIYTVADCIRGCSANQDFLASLIAPSEPPQSAISVLLVSMVNERQALLVRVAVSYCFQCYLSANRRAQSEIIMTLLPKSSEPRSVSAGQLLCGGLFSSDAPSTWFSAVTLLHCISDNITLKEELLRVHLASNQGGAPISLFQQCFSWLQKTNHFQTRIGLLQFLCTWLAFCPVAVRKILSVPISFGDQRRSFESNDNSKEPSIYMSILSTLISEATSTGTEECETLVQGLTTLLICLCILFNPEDVPGCERQNLLPTLEKRIGIDVILDRLNQISKAESFIMASKKPEVNVHTSHDLIFDYAFTHLFKRLEYEVIRLFQPTSQETGMNYSMSKTNSDKTDTNMIGQYEEKMVAQQNELLMLRNRISTLESELSIARLQPLSLKTTTQPSSNGGGSLSEQHVLELRNKLCAAETRIKELEDKLSTVEQDKKSVQIEQEDLLVLLHDQDEKIMKLCNLIKQLGGQVPEEILEDNLNENKDNLLSQDVLPTYQNWAPNNNSTDYSLPISGSYSGIVSSNSNQIPSSFTCNYTYNHANYTNSSNYGSAL